jgi:ATP-dependent DNA helicase RecG
LHYPTPDTTLDTLEDRSHPAWQRLKAEELLAQQLSQLQAKREHDNLRAPRLHIPAQRKAKGLPAQLLAALPFGLTGAQTRVVTEIAQDLARRVEGMPLTPPLSRSQEGGKEGRKAEDWDGIPMHRLLQGDVGSGKTVVAALAAAICIEAGWQCALMVPTEILAQQHFAKLVSWLEPLLTPRGKRVAWLTGSQKKKQRTEMLGLIASGEAALVVGTHAVIQAHVQFHSLALAIIDEQHRFGVQQRLALREKMHKDAAALIPLAPTATYSIAPTGASAPPVALQCEPHLLMMTATPIPRTLAMSYYADLNVSTLDELPPGRTPVVTKLVDEHRRDEVVERIRAQIEQGRQIYWVCPLIEESEHIDLINATATHEALCAALPGLLIGLLHSRMTSAEKQAVMALFTEGLMAVLVSTTVIEVGVDVPNASLMVIEHAERFGLSQLHQLRGRVGRGAAASACILLFSKGENGRLSETARARLKAMAETSDGFEIARRDLDIRGPGEFLGARQSGAPLLRFADLATDAELLEWARALAPRMLDTEPELAERHVARWLGGKSDYLKA